MEDMLQTSILISLNPRHAQIGALIGNSKALTCSRRSYLCALPQEFRTLMRDLLSETDTSKMASLMKHVNYMLRHEQFKPVDSTRILFRLTAKDDEHSSL